ncbi:hypothetical protein PIB30_069652 [Stylosanthes scabra]|uniref:C2H2-type domain-containing protein n=1 Tax=Stylosanthes scabra TaxID=79078 RepID=A0ABU6WN66_9FABA|nr:hypothetical protein [Stylosanthes scabra]
MKVELYRLKLCSSTCCHFSPERSGWKTHQSIHGLRAVDPRICVDFHAYAVAVTVQPSRRAVAVAAPVRRRRVAARQTPRSPSGVQAFRPPEIEPQVFPCDVT